MSHDYLNSPYVVLLILLSIHSYIPIGSKDTISAISSIAAFPLKHAERSECVREGREVKVLFLLGKDESLSLSLKEGRIRRLDVLVSVALLWQESCLTCCYSLNSQRTVCISGQ